MISVINILNSKGENRWIVVSSNLNPVIPVMKYVKYLDLLGRSANTLKTYAYHLKLYWSFLEIKNLNYDSIDLNILAEFISWLRHPKGSINLTYVNATKAKRSEKQ
ncbi:site-specific integrase [Bacillus vallismortis]|uniref:site-specific integrase n=1 Tax=Bacillus vallismortis TaxID=72361 RepID=UPI002DB71018|nr:site-specific integrase [Bacillus vallismortis]MEC1649457.1 site-specific integrase [Bacillus vallismortis]